VRDLFFLFLAALNRPLLNSVWHERIWRILDIEDRRYNIFIEPDLLATFSLGPVPSSSVRALVKANKKRRSLSFAYYIYIYIFFLNLGMFLACRREHHEA
jgi:hypothetical protein